MVIKNCDTFRTNLCIFGLVINFEKKNDWRDSFKIHRYGFPDLIQGHSLNCMSYLRGQNDLTVNSNIDHTIQEMIISKKNLKKRLKNMNVNIL